MLDFEYCLPRSLEEALSVLRNGRKATRVLAGGTDLIVQMKEGKVSPAVVVDVKNIRELNRLESDGDGTLHIGAAVSLSRITAFPPVMEKFGMLHQACSLIGSVRIRNRATMGGNICNAAPSADSASPLLCLGARAIIAGLKGKTRTVPLDSFFVGPGQTVLADDELLVEIEIPAPPAASAGAYLRHTPREEMDIAVVGGASFLVMDTQEKQCREARIALGAVAPTPIRAPEAEVFLKGRPLSDDVIEEASVIAAGAASPISDMRGSAEYRRELVKVLVRKTLREAWRTLDIRN